MASQDKLFAALLGGRSDRNIRFADLRKMVLTLGFAERIKGDHYIFTRPEVQEIINLQPLSDGKAKPYQVKQVRQIITRYQLGPQP